MTKKPNLIQQILLRNKDRELAKKEYDSFLTLSAENNKKDKVIKLSSVSSDSKTFRLLDEGMVVSSDSYPLFYIKKGAIEEFYELLSDDYVGSVNIGHLDFATFPFLVGQWAKKDLTIVDIGDGRKGLDVTPELDSESVFIKELKRAEYPIGISSEFGYELDWEATEEFGIEMIQSISIKDFAIVGEAGNVGSSNINLNAKENENMSEREKKSVFERFFNKYSDGKELGAVNDQKKEDEKEKGASEEGNDPKNPKDPKDPENPEDPKNDDNSDDGATPNDAEALTKGLEEAAEIIEQQDAEIKQGQEDQERALSIMGAMETRINELEAENAKLKGNNAQLSSSAERGLARFESIVKNMNLNVTSKDSEKNNKKDKPVITNGIGEV